MSREYARINADENEVVLGPLIFEWDAAGGGIQIAKNEDEAVAYIDGIRTSQWEDFVYACLNAASEVES